MIISNIDCQRDEYRFINGVWELINTSTSLVDSHFITNMLEGGYYFCALGGKQCTYKSINSFGNIVEKIIVDSVCRTIKCVYTFSYRNAKCLDDINYINRGV